MPKRVPQRRRGKGSPVYRVNSHRFKALSSYKSYDEEEKTGVTRGIVLDLMHDPARSAPLMVVQFPYETVAVPAPLGVMTGQTIEAGVNASINTGNVLPLKSIPEGTLISNIELTPGDGGKLIRSAGSKAKLVSKDKRVRIKLSSKAFKDLHPDCRATIGVVAGGGHKNKPLVKAGNSYYKHKAKGGRRWPLVSATAKNAMDHPHGGKQHRKRKSRTVSRNAPPGAKVGSFGARRTGKGGRRRKK